MNRKNGNRNDGDIQFDINNEKKINDPLGNFLEKGNNMISEYMNDKFKRLSGIILKEEELKIKRAREDEQRARRDAKRAREKLEEDIQIEKEKKIKKFEDEIKLVDLEKNLKAIIYDLKGFTRKEKIIPLNEESEEENQDNADIKSKKKKEKKLI